MHAFARVYVEGVSYSHSSDSASVTGWRERWEREGWREEVKILVWSDGASAGETCARRRACVCEGENDKGEGGNLRRKLKADTDFFHCSVI